MSSKASMRSLRSGASSMGETTSSGLSGGSSTRRRRREAAQQEQRVPPTMMSAEERLMLVRNALSRLAYVCERQLHTAPLDQVEGSEAVTDFFQTLRAKLPKLEYNPRKLGTPEKGGPKQLQYIAKEIAAFHKTAEAVLKSVDTSVAASEAASVYAGLQRNHTLEAIRELEELTDLLTHTHSEMPTRVNTELLADLVAFHINEFDAFAEQRVSAYVKETINEGAFYSGGVMQDASQQAKPIGVSSVAILDVAIGVRPGRTARMVLEHAIHGITRVENRVHAADIVLTDLDSTNATEAERADQITQQRLCAVVKSRIQEGLAELTTLRTQWEELEAELFHKAASPAHALDALMETKRFKEAEVIEIAQDIHDRVIHAALPFAAPQYHRRYGETYGQPCHVRIGFYFMADPGTSAAMSMEAEAERAGSAQGSTQASLYLDTLNAQFLPLMAERKVPVADHATYSYLVPSKEQVWLSFEEFPEMVRGARCALRGVDTRLDHFRALEEQKEVGGYFVMRGGERILRALLMQRCNVAINITRDKFQTQGPNFSNKAVVIRCKRSSGLTVQNYFYYTTAGEIIFSFARKVVWHIPLPLLLAATCTTSASTAELYRLLTLGMPGGSHPARVEALLQHHSQKPYGELTNFLDLMTVLGRMYREYHENSMTFRFLPQFVQGAACQHDAWYGLFMLRRHVLPHLNVDAATPDLSPDATAEELAAWLPENLRAELDRKFDALVAIARQLYMFYDGKLEHQGNDVPAYQELFTVSQALMAGFEVCLNGFFKSYAHRLGRHIPANLFHSILRLRQSPAHEAGETMRQVKDFVDFCNRRVGEPLRPLYSLLITGNLVVDREEDFYTPQTSGWVVMAEHLNFYRFFEQLRCVHRGKTIAGMRSSEVRKYPCESYGFICMVHSPDGEDCGVLNHLNVNTIMSNSFAPQSTGKETLREWLNTCLPCLRTSRARRLPDAASTATNAVVTAVADRLVNTVPVWVEGELIGYVTPAEAHTAAASLRRLKAVTDAALVDVNGVIRRPHATPLHTLEVVYVQPGSKDPAGLYLFYECGRLMRPVQKIESSAASQALAGSGEKQLAFPLVFVGTWEQTWLDIASVPTDLVDGVVQLGRKYEFMEQNGSNLISLTSTTIPFFEYNCSPRNLFQCGLSKQSAGTQLQALAWRREAKLFRVYAPQRYISRTLPMDFYGLDDVNLGVNAVIAILAYTGYDLDDAVILNSTASQRGMLTAGITVGKIITASGSGAASPNDKFVFHNVLATGDRFTPELGANGLPFKRANPELETSFNFTTDHKYPALHDNNDVYCCARRVERVDTLTNKRVYEYSQHHATKWRHFDKGEDAWVHQVLPLAFDGPDPTSVLVIFRIPRPPMVGDKFSSRHGQKGTLPLHIRSHDLPFASASGITPDVIINPHAFPSRMTVGMVLEIMTGKVGAVEGRFIDNSAWSTVDDQPRVAEVIGDALLRSGYNRFGRERLVDGISGEEMEADVFMGVCGYQRLRHMVSDKWQARARTDAHTYRAVTKTGQPVKGRKRHGGVRVGEMERDGLLSHGMSEVVLDRLLHVSDKTKAFICPQCGSLLSIYERHATEYSTWKSCRFCGAGADESTDTIAMVEIPQVLRLWAAELTSIGIRVVLKTNELQQFS